MVFQDGFDNIVVDAVQFVTRAPRLAQGAAAGDVDDADGDFEVSMEEHAVKVRHGCEAIGGLRRALSPCDVIPHVIKGLVP